MKIIQEDLQKISKGWLVTFYIDLNLEELNLLQDKYSRYLEDYEIIIQNNKVYIKRYFEKLEPWEDETPEAVVKSIKLELNALLNP
ncbi:MAG: hypothetical protein KKF16_02040 [Euryarchaeota archaeon]|nr:hypothetical protein [Euryarchaeota archaeon]MBU4608215.1 hypothetical protein [Euryarchaeota archaeon]MBV1730086.1 hypothetical protein [Methanobacterium sp.]MBV1754607.1 hypothetical protein [Methanobacterium sp.]